MTALLVATPGGHLTQLQALVPRLPVDPDDALWVSSETPQARAALAGREVLWVPYSAPRDLAGALRHVQAARLAVRSRSFSIAVSTGASHAVPFLAVAARAGIPAHYIDSATRVLAPSLTGRLLAHVPGVSVYSQYRGRATAPWRYGGSVFEGWAAEPTHSDGVSKVLVTLGSAEGYGFRRLVERLLTILPASAEVRWQTGSTDTSGLGIDAVVGMSSGEMEGHQRWADVVVAHAGTGSALSALNVGKVPVLVPRSPLHGEHVDDHQLEIARELQGRGLAVVADADHLELSHLERASGLTTVTASSLPPFGLAA